MGWEVVWESKSGLDVEEAFHDAFYDQFRGKVSQTLDILVDVTERK